MRCFLCFIDQRMLHMCTFVYLELILLFQRIQVNSVQISPKYVYFFVLSKVRSLFWYSPHVRVCVGVLMFL